MSSSTSSAVAAVHSMIYLGMDVHKESITIAVLPAGTKSPSRLDKLPNDLLKLKKWLERIARDGEIRACYEASGAGYVIHRAMKEWGYEREVIAPSRATAVLLRNIASFSDGTRDRDRRLAAIRAPLSTRVLPGSCIKRRFEWRPHSSCAAG